MWNRFGNIITGILGTLILHLLVAIIFMTVKLSSLYREQRAQFIIEFPEEETEEVQAEEEVLEVPAELAEQFEEEITNIARNISMESDPEVDRQAYLEQLQKEMEETGQLKEDNILEQMNREEEQEAGETALKTIEAEAPDTLVFKSKEMAARFSGATRIYYKLAERVHRSLPLPVYKCRNAGKVALVFHVNRNGLVKKASILKNESNTEDPCLLDAAYNAIMNSRFNYDPNAPSPQEGIITYFFVAQ